MLTEAVRLPLADGVNVTLIGQLPSAATELPQVLVSEKSLAFVPVTVMLVMPKAPLPVLLRVTVCAALVVPTGWLPKPRLVGKRLTTGPVPVPERLTVCGLPLALSVMLTEAVRLPLADGVNVTLIGQLPPAAAELPQVLVSEKSLAFVPVTVMLVMLKAALPVLLRVTVCAALVIPTGWLPKPRLVGKRLTTGAVPVEAVDVPVPERLTVCGLPLALSVMLTEAVRVPLAGGVKVTLIVQWAPAATELPHVLVSAKFLLLVPMTARLVILKVALPVLLRVTVCAALVVPTGWLKVRLVDERLTVGAALNGLPRPLSVMLKASAMQAVERITAFARSRCTALVSMGVASCARVLPILGRPLALHIRLDQLTLCPKREG
jgi:hypothetical protein